MFVGQETALHKLSFKAPLNEPVERKGSKLRWNDGLKETTDDSLVMEVTDAGGMVSSLGSQRVDHDLQCKEDNDKT